VSLCAAHGRVCSQLTRIMHELLTRLKNTQVTATLLTNGVTRRRGDKTGVKKISPLLAHLLNCVECAGRLLNSKQRLTPVYKPLTL